MPNKTTFHAHHICDMALDMLSSIDHLKDPSTGDNIQIRVGEQRSSLGCRVFISKPGCFTVNAYKELLT